MKWYSGDIVEYEKHKQLVQHVADVEAARQAGRMVVKAATFVDRTPPDLDGRSFAWVTELDDNEAA
jgi:hypothetical protein